MHVRIFSRRALILLIMIHAPKSMVSCKYNKLFSAFQSRKRARIVHSKCPDMLTKFNISNDWMKQKRHIYPAGCFMLKNKRILK